MIQPRFLQIHTLTSFAGVLLNRDDTGAAKRMPYGGAVRTRISSQCLKRHWRKAAGEWALETKATESVRTRHIFERELQEAVREATQAPDDVIEAVGKAVTLKMYGKEEVKERQAMLFGRAEIDVLKQLATELVQAAVAASMNAKAAREHAEKQIKDQNKNLSAISQQAGNLGFGLTAALFGRMVTSDPKANTDAAIHVAHAFTVHREDSEGDYFTVVDDLPGADGEAGSGGIFDTEITSGLFYSYVVIDVPLLVSNLTGCEADAAFGDNTDRTLPAKIAKSLVHLIATVSPGAKKGSTAPYAYAELMLVEAGARQPRSLAAAFRSPIVPSPTQPLAETAITAAIEQLQRFDTAYDPHEARRVMNATHADASALGGTLSLPALAAWVAEAIRIGGV